MPVGGLWVDRRDNPIGRDAPGDAEHLVIADPQVLAYHPGQKLPGADHLGVELPAVQDRLAPRAPLARESTRE